jgi:hypothetical protein
MRGQQEDRDLGVILHWIDLQADLRLRFKGKRFLLWKLGRMEGDLLSTFSACYSVGGVKKIVRLEVGMPTDGASIPRPLWAIVGAPLDGEYTFAAVLHDAGYRGQFESRAVIDCLFRLGIQYAGGISGAKWGAVRAFAGFTWRANRRTAKAFASRYIRIETIANQGNASLQETEQEQRRRDQ